jgi:hypothetical protein
MYAVWFGLDRFIKINPKSDQIQRFSKKDIKTHPKLFGFLRFSIFIWIDLDLNKKQHLFIIKDEGSTSL